MKNKKIIIIVAMIITIFAFFMMNMNSVKGFEGDDFIINEEDDNTINNEANETSNNEVANNAQSNTQNNEMTINNDVNENTAENKLPQTGVAEDTTLFIFIGICLISAIYAYTKIRRYRSI